MSKLVQCCMSKTVWPLCTSRSYIRQTIFGLQWIQCYVTKHCGLTHLPVAQKCCSTCQQRTVTVSAELQSCNDVICRNLLREKRSRYGDIMQTWSSNLLFEFKREHCSSDYMGMMCMSSMVLHCNAQYACTFLIKVIKSVVVGSQFLFTIFFITARQIIRSGNKFIELLTV